MKKMIVVDLDGTILNDEKKVSDTTKEYLTKLKDNGYIITIATGRIFASALDATDGALFADYIITDNGTCIYKTENHELIFGNYVNKEIASNFFNYYDDDCRYIDFCNKDKIYKYSDDSINSKIIDNTKDKEYILNNCKNISHITIAMNNNDKVLEVYEELSNKFKESLEILIMRDSYSSYKWLDIMPISSSKYNMINKLRLLLGVDNKDIIAFGDGLNDIEMIKNCGTGVALINAFEELKEVSDAITEFDNNNDGVINYLKKLLNDK